MKIVKHGSKPLSDREFAEIKRLAENNSFNRSERNGIVLDRRKDVREKYIKRIIGVFELKALKALKIVINSGNELRAYY